MSRQKKNPQYDAERLMKGILEAVGDAYLHPLTGRVDSSGYASLNSLADEFSMTPLKIRKLLITSGLYKCDQSRLVEELRDQGKTLDEIMAHTGLSRASVHSYLPYTKGIYNMRELSAQAERLRRYRDRKHMVERLSAAISESGSQIPYDLFWETLRSFADYPFRTAHGEKFSYEMEDGAICFCGDKRRISRNYLDELLLHTIEAKDNEIMDPLDEMEDLRDGYLHIVFQRIGIYCQ